MNWKGVNLYHYTDFYALNGIIVDKELWLTNVRTMNDRKEMHLFMQKLQKQLIKELPEKKTDISEVFNEQMQKLSNEQAYSVSFSKLYDDAAQWERYGHNGMGVMICFDAEKFEKCFSAIAPLQPVFYEHNLSEHQIKEVLKEFFVDGTVPYGWKDVNSVFGNAWSISAAHKHMSFKTEGEVRACLIPFMSEYCGEEACYKIEKWGIREYYPLKWGNKEKVLKKGLIKEIMIGPKAMYGEGVMERFLKKNGAEDITVTYSECPLRWA